MKINNWSWIITSLFCFSLLFWAWDSLCSFTDKDNSMFGKKKHIALAAKVLFRLLRTSWTSLCIALSTFDSDSSTFVLRFLCRITTYSWSVTLTSFGRHTSSSLHFLLPYYLFSFIFLILSLSFYILHVLPFFENIPSLSLLPLVIWIFSISLAIDLFLFLSFYLSPLYISPVISQQKFWETNKNLTKICQTRYILLK